MRGPGRSAAPSRRCGAELTALFYRPRRLLLLALGGLALGGCGSGSQLRTTTDATVPRLVTLEDTLNPSVYPPPVKAHPDGALGACPSPSGLEAFNARARKLAGAIAHSYGHASLAVDLRNSDRAWWPHVRAMWRWPAKERAEEVVYGFGTGSRYSGGYSPLLVFSCGEALVTKTVGVGVGPRQSGHNRGCNACISTLFFVNRRGKPLIYYEY